MSTIPRLQYNKPRSRRQPPPPIPNSTRPILNLSTKPGHYNEKGGRTYVASAPNTPRITRSPRPSQNSALHNKKSYSSIKSRTSSPINTDEYTFTAVPASDDQNILPSRFPSDDSGISESSRLQRLMTGLGLGVKVPNLPTTPVFNYPKNVQPRKSRADLERGRIGGVQTPTFNDYSHHQSTSPYSEISSEIDRMQTEFLTPRIPSDAYASAARQAIADSQTPPFALDRRAMEDRHVIGEPELPPTESESSSIEELRVSNEREQDQDGFSSGAEKLFRELSTKSGKAALSASQRARSASASERNGCGFSTVSDSTQASSRSHLLTSLRSEERRFVSSIRDALTIFALPLRLKSLSQSPVSEVKSTSPGWIDGLPAPIGRLFDWLEDIIVVHERLLIEMDSALSLNPNPGDSLEIEDCLMNFVSHLEVYQGYLVRCEAVIELIDALVEQADSNDFGEFVLMQSKDPICKQSGRNLASYLRMPIARLSEYPIFFKNLLEITSYSHPSYITTLALYHSCKTTIEVLNEVKHQEEEYEVLKRLEERIEGLEDHSNQWRLARRERRLTAQGLLKLVLAVDDEGQPLYDRLHVPSVATPRETAPGTPKLGKSRHHVHFKRSEVPNSASTNDSIVTEWPQTDSTLMPGSTQYTYQPSPRPRAASASRVQTPSRQAQMQEMREVSVYVFIFADIVLFTLPGKKGPLSANKSEDGLTLMRGIGVSKILAVQDVPGQQFQDYLIQLDLLPVFAPAPGLETHVARVHLGLPEKMISRIPGAPSSIILDARKKWLAAFRRSYQHTIRSLSYPTEEKLNQPQQQDFLDSLEVIRTAGLPMPKSPSQQLIAEPTFTGRSLGRVSHKEKEIEGEREERGFWSLRFQLVMKERRRTYSIWANGRPIDEDVEELDNNGDELRQRRISSGYNVRENVRKAR